MKLIIIIAMLVCSLFAELGSWKQLTNIQNDTYANVALKLVKNKLEQTKCQFGKLEKAYSQIVSGINYKFEVEMLCENGINEDYEVIVFSQPWTGTIKIISMNQLDGKQQNENK